MTDFLERVEEVREHLDPRWDETRVELSLLRLQQKARRRARARVAVGVVAVVGLLATGPLVSRALLGSPPPPTGAMATGPAPSEPPPRSIVRFLDGSTATVLEGQGELALLEQTPARLSAQVVRGRYRFEVIPASARVFQVKVGAVTVSVLGTAFTVQPDGLRAHVAVERGRVRVEWPGGERELGTGEQGWFPPPGQEPVEPAPRQPADAGASLPPPDTAAQRPQVRVRTSTAAPALSWKALAQAGDFDRAYALLRTMPPADVPDVMDELLLAADAARLSGHPAEALTFLRRAEQHREDPRSSLAAFTRGKLLLGPLGQPTEAAAAFEAARRLAPEGSLAEDALAREVEAWSRAGDRARARARAQEYLRLHPHGLRADEVRRLGEVP